MIVFKRLLNSRFSSDLIFSYGSQGIVILAGFFQLYLINRFFGIEIFGQYSIIVATIGIFSSIVTARSSEAVTRFLKREEINANFSNAKLVIIIGLVVDTTTAFLLLALSYFVSTWFADLFLKDSTLWFELFLYAFVVFFGFLKGTFIGVLQAKEKFKIINALGALTATFNVVFIYIAYIAFGNSLKLLIFAFIASSFLSTLLASFVFYYIYRVDYVRVSVNINMHLIKEYWNFNIKTFLSSSLKAGNQNIESLVIGYFVSAQAVGLYQTLKKLVSPIAIAVQPLALLTYPKMIRYFEKGTVSKIQSLVVGITKFVLVFSIVFILSISMILEPIMSIMEVEFELSYLYYFYVMCLTMVFAAMQWWARPFANTVNPMYSVNMNLFATIYQLIVLVAFTYVWGVLGAIWALFLLQLSLAIIWFYLGKRCVSKSLHS
jgi:O-antigen/teichoic acid export membrane protein